MSFTKKLIIALLVLVTSAIAITTASSFRTRNSQDTASQPKILAKQLPLLEGVIPVEIRDLRASFPKATEVENFSCVTRNNTAKNATSIVLDYTIVTESRNGGEIGDTIVLYRESLVHPDVREAHRYRPLSPGEEFTFESSGRTWFESPIKRVEARIDYVEFDDNTKLGADGRGSKIINDLRQGAAAYKSWLVQQYKQSGSSVDAIVPLLKARALPRDLAFDSTYSNQGAKVYRDHMLRVFNEHGRGDLERYLSR